MEVKEAIESLKEYVEQDDIYTIYKKDKSEIDNDYDLFCVEHCEAIEILLKELEIYKRDIEIVDEECSRLEKIEFNQNKIIDMMAEEILIKRAWAFKVGGETKEEELKELKTKIIKEYKEKIENEI